VSAEAEIQGLDMPEFGVLAYPDFVQHHAAPGHVTADSEAISLGEAETVGSEA
jgi:hypothetical protein